MTASSEEGKKDDLKLDSSTNVQILSPQSPQLSYRLYKRRFLGLGAMIVLNLVSAMAWPWFGPIANNTSRDFSITLDQVSWLGNIMALIYLPTSFIIPILVSKYDFRRCCDVGALFLLISGWIRYASTTDSLSSGGAYALLFLGQVFSAVAQPVFQVLAPKYSELWFDLKGRTTATMLIAISNPIGGALAQLLSPLVGDTMQSILVLAIISSVAAPFVFLISAAPPTPPTFAASQDPPSLRSLLRAWVGKEPRDLPTHMTLRERIDFTIITLVFGLLSGMSNTFAVLSNQYLEPAGYSADLSGLMGATLILSGVLAAFITAPLFDRVLTHHLAITAKIFVPIVCVAWLSLFWAVRPGNAGALFAIMAIIGVTSVTMLPVGLELACELTRNADASSAVLWFACNLVGFVFISVNGALRAPESADPPLNMKKALLFNGVMCVGIGLLILFIKGHQRRREMDQLKLEETRMARTMASGTTAT